MPIAHHAAAKRCMRPLLLALLAGAAIGALAPLPARSQDISAGNFYFFGDSAMGQGNYSAIVGEVGEDHSPYSSNNGHQRESNGLVWTEMLGRDVDIIADPDANSSNLNFAISGAHMTRGGDLTAFGVETGVAVQTEAFGQLVDNGGLQVGDADVAFVVAGANDFLDRLDQGDSAEEIMADVAQAAAANVSRLADAGLKTIVLSEVQPLQFAPDFADAPEVGAELESLVFATNSLILADVAAASLPADVNVVTMRYDAMVRHMRQNAAGLGFTEITTPCFDDDAGTLCGTDPAVQNQHIFFDDLHFSEGAHRVAAQWWGATLEGANGRASRSAARIADIFQYELEASQRRFGVPTLEDAQVGKATYFANVIYDVPRLKGRGDDLSVSVRALGGVWGGQIGLSQDIAVGLSFRFSDTNADFEGGGGFDGRTYAGQSWLAWSPDWATLTVNGGGGVLDVDRFRRATGVDLLTASGSTKGHYWTFGASALRSWDIAGFTASAEAGVHTSALTIDGFAETGANGLNLRYDRHRLRSTRAQVDLGLRGKPISLSQNVDMFSVFDLSYRHEFEQDPRGFVSQLIDNSADEAVWQGAGPSRHRVAGSTGFDLAFHGGWSIGARYERTFASDVASADAVRITARLKF